MQLASVRLVSLGPFDDLTVPFHDDDGAPRSVVVVFGGGGVGKTTLLAAIAATRPGHAVAQPPRRGEARDGTLVVTEWALGQDDAERPHGLRVVSPNAVLVEDEAASLFRRREQALFDKRALDGGFVLVSFSGARWMSRSSAVLTTPERTIARYDVRASHAFDDATRADLARETKQALVYASIGAALARDRDDAEARRLARFEEAIREVSSKLGALAGARYVGADAATLEPTFETEAGRRVPFDELSTAARALVALGALTTRALFAAYPRQDARHAEGVVLVDDAHLHLDPAVQRRLVPTLRDALPKVQWVLTTSSGDLAAGAEAGEVLALRRMATRIELHGGALAIVH